MGHNYLGHNHIGHNYIGHNYLGQIYQSPGDYCAIELLRMFRYLFEPSFEAAFRNDFVPLWLPCLYSSLACMSIAM